MASNHRYATLDHAPLKVMAQLRSLSPTGDKDILIQRLVEQDRKTAIEIGLDAHAFEAGDPDDKSWDWDFEEGESSTPKTGEFVGVGDDGDDGGVWEVVGAKKGSSKRGVKKEEVVEHVADLDEHEVFESSFEELSDERDGEDALVTSADEVGSAVASGDNGVTLTPSGVLVCHSGLTGNVQVVTDAVVAEPEAGKLVVDATQPVVEESNADIGVGIDVGEKTKKKRRRGKKGGKKVNKNTFNARSNAAVEENIVGSPEPRAAPDVTPKTGALRTSVSCQPLDAATPKKQTRTMLMGKTRMLTDPHDQLNIVPTLTINDVTVEDTVTLPEPIDSAYHSHKRGKKAGQKARKIAVRHRHRSKLGYAHMAIVAVAVGVMGVAVTMWWTYS